jgi:hypothetical protein
MRAPAVLGFGKRLSEPGTPPHWLKLVETKIGSGGVIINTDGLSTASVGDVP